MTSELLPTDVSIKITCDPVHDVDLAISKTKGGSVSATPELPPLDVDKESK